MKTDSRVLLNLVQGYWNEFENIFVNGVDLIVVLEIVQNKDIFEYEDGFFR